MRQDKEKAPGVFGKEVDCVDEETWFNTKSAKQNAKGTKQIERRGRRPKRIFVPFVFCFALFVFLSRSLIGLSWRRRARYCIGDNEA
jgi:hypothetical protein